MNKLILLLTITVACFRAGAVILVGPTSTGNSPFDAIPSVTNWSTVLVSGAATDVTDAAGLDAAVQLLSAASINTVLGSSGTTPPSINTLARFNTTGLYLQTRPTQASTKMVVLMTSLKNDTGGSLSALTISYTLGAEINTGATFDEQVSGYRVYFNLTGNAGDWQPIAALSVPVTTASTNRLRATVNLGTTWTAGSTLYLLWADDNGSGADTGAVPAEGAYTIDNFSATPISAPISFGVSGTATEAFSVFPPETHWSTFTSPGAAGDIPDTATLDLAVQTVSATDVGVALGTSASVNPPTANLFARYNTINLDVQTRTTGAKALALMATLRNDSGAAVSAIAISYNFFVEAEPASPITEETPGQRVYYSLTGTPGDWHVINDLSTGTAGALSTVVNIGSWTAGSLLYLLWADDNGSGGTTVGQNIEGAYHFDNFIVEPAAVGVTITAPDDNTSFPQGVPISVSAAALLAGTVTNVSFFADGNFLTNITAAPFSFSYVNASLGAHNLTAQAKDNLGNSATSPIIHITVIANNPPTLTVTNAFTQSFLVGANVVNNVMAADSDGTVTRVEFYLDGVLVYTDTTSAYKYEYDDALAGTHTVRAVAVDNAGFRGTNSISFTITNPPNVTLLLTNGSTWKYLDDTNDPSLAGAWTTIGFNDSAWSSGVGEIGFGDSTSDRPEVTQARRVLTNTLDNTTYTNVTFYFRKVINVTDPTVFSGLILNVKQDDGSIVYFNGVEVYRSTNMPAGPVNHGTFALTTQPDDGAAYYTTNLPTSVLSSGPNIIAVEMHQDAFASSDISFDVMLWGTTGGSSGPSLKITRTSATQADISWPIGGAALLYFTGNLNSPTTWTLETALDTPSGGFHHVTVNTAGGMKYWTLRQ